MSFPRYPEYKPSGVEWRGEVPEHWEVNRLKYVAPLVTERAETRSNPVALENIESWTGTLLPTDSQFEGEGTQFRTGDILFGKLRPYLAKIHFATRAGEAVGDFHVVRPTADVDGRFLQHSMLRREFIDIIDGTTFGSKMPRASWEALGAMPTPLPPLPEQRAIAAFLDRETAKIDVLVAEQQRLIELLKEKRQAVISHAVTKGLDPKAPMKPSGVEWLGDVPAHWEASPLRSLARPGANSFTDGDWIEAPFITDEGVRLLQTGNIGVGTFKEQGFRFISEQSFNNLGCTEVDPGDVLICRLAEPVGRACLAPSLNVRMITSVDVCILKTSAHVCPRFLVHLMSSAHYLGFMEGQCRGGTRDRVSRSFLAGVRLLLPPLPEQRAISAFLDRETAKIDGLVAEAESAITLLQERRSALSSAAVTGQIDVRNAVAMEAV